MAKLVKAFETLSHTRAQNATIAEIERTVAALEKTYRRQSSEVPRLGISKAYLSLAAAYAAHDQQKKAIEFAFKTLESLGYTI